MEASGRSAQQGLRKAELQDGHRKVREPGSFCPWPLLHTLEMKTPCNLAGAWPRQGPWERLKTWLCVDLRGQDTEGLPLVSEPQRRVEMSFLASGAPGRPKAWPNTSQALRCLCPGLEPQK